MQERHQSILVIPLQTTLFFQLARLYFLFALFLTHPNSEGELEEKDE